MARQMRTCIACNQTDNHAKHDVIIGEESVSWHFDCHAASQKCPACVESMKGNKGKRGFELLKALGADVEGEREQEDK